MQKADKGALRGRLWNRLSKIRHSCSNPFIGLAGHSSNDDIDHVDHHDDDNVDDDEDDDHDDGLLSVPHHEQSADALIVSMPVLLVDDWWWRVPTISATNWWLHHYGEDHCDYDGGANHISYNI